MSLTDELENVVDLETFLNFVQALIDDWEDNEVEGKFRRPDYANSGSDDWQNWTIGSYFEAAHAWARTTEMGKKQGVSSSPSWKAFALFLYMGKIYE
jgi:hypothetical protein